MRRSLGPLRFALAFLGATLSGAAPAVAYAQVSLAGHPGYAEICTARGSARGPLDPAPAGDNRLADSASHCALCLGPGGGHALVGSGRLLTARECTEPPVGIIPAARTPVEPIRSARPRGPPASDRFA
jgi:hypothetical protein